MWRKTAVPLLGLVGADALEDARAVVEAVAEYVDRWRRPMRRTRRSSRSTRPASTVVAPLHDWSQDEPRRVGHLGRVVAVAARGRRCAARRRARDRRAVRRRPRPQPSPWRSMHGRREDGGERVGDALAGDVGRRAVDRLEDARAAVRRGCAEGSMPSEPVSIAASSVRMSPNMFSVTITSKSAGRETSCIAALSTSRWSSSTSGYSPATPLTTSRQSREVSSTLALSTDVTRPAASAAARPRRPTRAIRSISSAV